MNVKTPTLDTFKLYFDDNKDSILNDYFEFLKFKSISTEKEHEGDLIACVNWLKKKTEDIGFNTQLWQTSGHPTLYAENLQAGPGKPTLLIYNHYDVQPVDPLELWDTPPFEPTIKDNTVYARGAQDNKGQCMYVFQALKGMMQVNNALPINIKWVVEGEEEAGSKGLSSILQEKREQLKSDYIAIADLGIPSQNTPSVTLGVRGIITMDVEVTGSNTDLHSGTHGGRAYNPLHALVEILSKLRDNQGRILVPGFYDSVAALPEKDRESISFDFDEENYTKTFGIPATGGEKNFAPLERSTIRPTLEINGINGGYSGDGFKTVIPAKATAKLSCRLVPHQDPESIGKNTVRYIESIAPKGISVKVNLHKGMGAAVRANPSSKIVRAYTEAYAQVFNTPCSFSLEGGSIPIITELSQACGGELVLMGMGLDDDQIHAPNEHFGLDRFERGFLVTILAIEALSREN
ncbi:MAG: dipeptidase [Chlamydiota bacterium]|nr:dipeptidase [Chlamydiota bacterium]